MGLLKFAAWTVAGLLVWEGGWWLRRRARRADVYAHALAYAHAMGRPLVVIGAPDGGVTAGYGCGDITVDQQVSMCPNSFEADITKPLPFSDDSVVTFTSCVLEYVDDADAAFSEIHRISGGHAFFVGVPPWTLTAYLYPGAKRTLPSALR
jgi:hypothetical protein